MPPHILTLYPNQPQSLISSINSLRHFRKHVTCNNKRKNTKRNAVSNHFCSPPTVVHSNLKCSDRKNSNPVSGHENPVPGPTECRSEGAEDEGAGVGPAAGEVRAVVREQEAVRLRAGAFQRAVRGEHILGERRGVDPGAGGGGVGGRAEVVPILVQLLRRRSGLRPLHADRVARNAEDRVRQSDLLWW